MNEPLPNYLVFSDLDGSLLDHHTYSFEQARGCVERLERLRIPLILCSSKTRAEIVELRNALRNNHPFIVENGAAIFIPLRYFPQQPQGTQVLDKHWVHEMAPPRSRWLELLAQIKLEFPAEFETFNSAGMGGVMRMTGLGEAEALRAIDRQFSEPVLWLGQPDRKLQFIQRLQDTGATISQGGRFLSVSGNCDKGRALCWLRDRYQDAASGKTIEDLAIGDSKNDSSMLAAASSALQIRSPVHDFPSLQKTDRLIRTTLCGPAGWTEGVTHWLSLNGYSI